jgi:TonB family protein
MIGQCARAEVLAGAIALGEATDVERDEYRKHLAGCASCLGALGGEREIERVMTAVASARDAETWEPDVRGALAVRRRTPVLNWRLGLSGIAAAVAVSLGIHALVAAGIPQGQPAAPVPVEISFNGMHVTLERRPPVRHLVVVHNVVTLHAPVAAAPAPVRAAAAAPPARAASPGKARNAAPATIAPSRSDEQSIAALRTAATVPPAARAESLALFPNVTTVRDVVPIGGEAAIVPQPAPIAYEEGAAGTTAFEVSVDDRGTPVKCTITKPSGYLVLDEAVCKAAMHAKYSPRTVNGRPVPSIYRDAFTFRDGQ